MKWTKAKDYYPEDWQLGRVIGTTIKFPLMFAPHLICDAAGKTYKIEDIEWMQESNEPVFSLEDMRKSWEDGEFNGVYNFQQNLGSKDAATFKDFMKEQYKISIP
jgi:hypothetical protein